MESGEVAKLVLFVSTLAVVVTAVGVLLGVLSLYMKRKCFSEESDAPYKLEPSNASDLVAVSDQPKRRGRPVGSKNKKRKYTKRSTYWNQFRKNAAAAKARRKYTKRSKYWKSEEMQDKLKKARQAHLSN